MAHQFRKISSFRKKEKKESDEAPRSLLSRTSSSTPSLRPALTRGSTSSQSSDLAPGSAIADKSAHLNDSAYNDSGALGLNVV